MNPLTTIPNPFRSAIVADPWQWGHWDAVDVPEIHQEAFDLCRRALDFIRRNHQSTSVLLHGDAGSGKTHLLARIQAWLAGALTIYGDAPPAVFISVRMQTSPQMIWRHLQSRFGEDLLRPTGNGRTQLERILLPRLAEVAPEIGEPRAWMESVQRASRGQRASQEFNATAEVERALNEVEDALDALDRTAGLNDRDLVIVLAHFILGRHRRDVRAWLRGESLPESALNQLGLKVEQEGDPEERARTLVLSLCRMTGAAIPLVFCFDQVEALQSHPHDLGGLHRFGQMVSFLRDETQNTLLISCILSTFLNALNEAVISSDYDRMRAFGERTLRVLDPGQARRLIEARLNTAPEIQKLRRPGSGRLWPLRESDIDAALARRIDTPRALLAHCADRFEMDWRPDLHRNRPSTQEFLTQEMEERLDRAASTVTPDQTGAILAHGIPLLLRMIDPPWEQQAISPIRGVELVLESRRGRILVSLCNQKNMTNLAAHLRRLRGQMAEQILEESARGKYLLLRDVRLPISSTARRTREYREELLSQGFQWIEVTAEMVAAVEALRCLWSEAKAGDLANGGESLSESTVQDWIVANLSTRLLPLQELLEAILPNSAPPNLVPPDLAPLDPLPELEDEFNLCEDIGELLVHHHLLSVEHLALLLDHDQATIEACARRHPERFGILSGPPPVLFLPTLEPVINRPEDRL